MDCDSAPLRNDASTEVFSMTGRRRITQADVRRLTLALPEVREAHTRRARTSASAIESCSGCHRRILALVATDDVTFWMSVVGGSEYDSIGLHDRCCGN